MMSTVSMNHTIDGDSFNAEWYELEKNVRMQMCGITVLSLTCYTNSDWVYCFCY